VFRGRHNFIVWLSAPGMASETNTRVTSVYR
jgi:hypothetical protein